MINTLGHKNVVSIVSMYLTTNQTAALFCFLKVVVLLLLQLRPS